MARSLRFSSIARSIDGLSLLAALATSVLLSPAVALAQVPPGAEPGTPILIEPAAEHRDGERQLHGYTFVEADLGPDLELEDIDRRSRVATSLYVSSIVLGVAGPIGTLAGIGLFASGLGGGGGANASLGLLVMVIGGLATIGHLVMLPTAIGLDVGSGARRRRHREAQGALSLRIGSGPGDVGIALGLTL